MNTSHLRDQRGVAMVLELILVAAVLALVGFTIYQSANRKTAANQTGKTIQSTENLATSAAQVADQASAADTDIANTAESAAAGELSDTDADITSLGDTANASF
jgi:hypothetical protein